MPADLLWLSAAGWRERFDAAGLITMGRPLLDHAVRERLTTAGSGHAPARPVEVLDGHEVTGLIPRDTDVAGVLVRPAGSPHAARTQAGAETGMQAGANTRRRAGAENGSETRSGDPVSRAVHTGPSAGAAAAAPADGKAGEPSGAPSSCRRVDGEMRADLVVDASTPAVSIDVVRAAVERGINVLVGTSGWSAERIALVRPLVEAAGTGAVFIPNFSLGSVLGSALAAAAAPFFPSIEIVEAHRETKIDSPSGTAIGGFASGPPRSRAVPFASICPSVPRLQNSTRLFSSSKLTGSGEPSV